MYYTIFYANYNKISGTKILQLLKKCVIMRLLMSIQ